MYCLFRCGCIENLYKMGEDWYREVIIPCDNAESDELKPTRLEIPVKDYIENLTFLTEEELKKYKLESL